MRCRSISPQARICGLRAVFDQLADDPVSCGLDQGPRPARAAFWTSRRGSVRSAQIEAFDQQGLVRREPERVVDQDSASASQRGSGMDAALGWGGATSRGGALRPARRLAVSYS